MKFGPVPLSAASGAVLAHSLMAQASDGKPYRIRKGTVLDESHLAGLAAAGEAQVIAARLEPGDVDEDAAAQRLAEALVPDPAAAGLRITEPATGRVNIYATGAGIVHIDATAVQAVNSVNPMITLATLLPYQRVAAGTMVGTVKIISYAVLATELVKACRVTRPAMRLCAPIFASATLIETAIRGETPSDKGRQATARRLRQLDMTLTERVVVPHAQGRLAAAIAAATGDVILILTGSATSDADDVAPQALRMAGGVVSHFGMPVDPGNLLFLGALGDKPVIGLPGCARSPALNGADWVLERVVCGAAPTPEDIAGMGVGGLLKEIPTRPLPRGKIDGGVDGA